MSTGVKKLNNLKAKHNALTREHNALTRDYKELTDVVELAIVKYEFMKNKTTTCRIVMENQTRLLEEIKRVLDEKLSQPRKLDLIRTVVSSKRKRDDYNFFEHECAALSKKHKTLIEKHETLIEKYNAQKESM